MARSIPSESPEGGFHRKPNWWLPWSWISQPPTHRDVNFYCLSYTVYDTFIIASKTDKERRCFPCLFHWVGYSWSNLSNYGWYTCKEQLENKTHVVDVQNGRVRDGRMETWQWEIRFGGKETKIEHDGCIKIFGEKSNLHQFYLSETLEILLSLDS